MAAGASYVMGQVMKRGVGRPDTVKIRCLKLTLSPFLNKYFNETKFLWAVEDRVTCGIGDIVLLKELPENVTPRVKHQLEDVVYPLGMVIDPVTGRRCRGKDYIDESERQAQSAFIAEEKTMPLS